MARVRPLQNPPITEALIDLRATLPADFKAEAFGSVGERLSAELPRSETIMLHEARISGAGISPSHQRVVHGYRFGSQDGHIIAQFRKDGFTYNRLKPYPGWSAFYSQAMDLWRLYVKIASPEAITRIAVRYINHLQLPTVPDNLSAFLTVPPTLPEATPGRMTGFNDRKSLHDAGSGMSAHIKRACEDGVEPGTVVIILDVDAFKSEFIGTDVDNLPGWFIALREFKNLLFFGSITEATAEMYE